MKGESDYSLIVMYIFRPSGNLIVSSQRLPHRHDIVFIERNGLRHGEFTLREKTNHKLLEVSWNADSTVLAVWLEAENPVTGKSQKTGTLLFLFHFNLLYLNEK